jgi:hypothetical protein
LGRSSYAGGCDLYNSFDWREKL